MPIRNWSTTAASNNSASPNGAPEGMAPSTVNDIIRQQMADHKTQWQTAEWFDWGDTPSRASATTFKIATDVTSRYIVNRQIQLNDATTLYGTITGSSYSAPDTTVTVETRSSSLTSSLSSVALAVIAPTNLSLPKNVLYGIHKYAADAGSNDTYAITVTPTPASYVTGMVIRFKANTANTGACSLNVNSIGAVTIKKNYNADLADNDIKANQIVEVIYDGTNFQLLSPVSNLGTGTVTSVATSGLATGGAITSTGTVTVTAATQSDQETATSTTTVVTPAVQQYHPSAAKAWINFNGTGTVAISGSYNITSITDNGTGDWTVTIGTDFSSAFYSVVFSKNNSSGLIATIELNSIAAGSFQLLNFGCASSGNTSKTARDDSVICATCFGDQ